MKKQINDQRADAMYIKKEKGDIRVFCTSVFLYYINKIRLLGFTAVLLSSDVIIY
ncbi:hypothetical protein CLOSTMETH_03919 [[Clostridium] methylpentosum DSM 5476]|uniref:Uncharacterized protein n=1 Tax=[Clostridium] methylpentosum DSM 5476 TaxID=537013 RepID=C0EJ68_9FIRM|nr:hypothetical protein CLOSTMETH_03919 [[Clostridium] methylpentosum DSM 5476]